MRAREGEQTERYTMDLDETNQDQVALVGGKAANLGELSRIDGIHVPAGFCVTTHAFRRVRAETPAIDDLIVRLSRLQVDHSDTIRALAAELRTMVEGVAIPTDVATAITHSLGQFGEQASYAVRSSATAEDLPTASFAGQHDSYLNISGRTAILHHISRCWASLFSERAVVYRMKNGVDHRNVDMAVIVQRMILPHASGVLFTADPVTGNRKVLTVEACYGLGEALVSGVVNADVYNVRDDSIVARTIALKEIAIEPALAGGTRQRSIEPERQRRAALKDAQVTRLARLGRRIETHFRRPQDIEWCLIDDDFQIVQSRPITTLFPIPGSNDGKNHVYVSVGHQQMMTDAMKPLGVSIWQLIAARPMYEAGGRLFVDVSRELAAPASRVGLVAGLGKSDPLIGAALQNIIDRDFIPLQPNTGPASAPASTAPPALETDARIVADLISRGRASNAKLEREIHTLSGSALLDFIATDAQELKRVLFEPRSHQAILAGMEAAWWLNDHLEQWLGDKNAADILTQSVPNNITSEMGLDLLHVADVIRPHPPVVAFLERVHDEDFLNDLPALAGGAEAKAAIESWLDKYGMRCSGEIDVTRPRWIERPAALVPLIVGNIKNFRPGAGKRRFDEGLLAARTKETELLARLRSLPDGDQKAREVKSMIDRLRTFIGYREYPKYFIVDRLFAYKQALMKEADRLVRANLLHAREDIFFLTFRELQEVIHSNDVDDSLIRERKASFQEYQRLSPPRVLTSDGEVVSGKYQRDNVPAGALVGLPVSAGTVEGRARVVFDLAKADLEPGDILVTPFTDPSWTPLFVAIKGLVTEVGGLMTHGAVIAREYGLPAVVGVEHATRLIRDKQRIRVNGTDGSVEVLSASPSSGV